ncbi:MAG: TatD family deoxyribonuclease [Bacteroidetes bacterium]|jgi:TatD DNase family protein|nr:TatD family deoxyribonuclease [Bacteroidota bacterium]
MILTDTHTHLYSKEFEPDNAALIEKAIKSGVTRFFMPNVDSESIPGMFQIEKQFPENCFPMMGLHPCSVNQTYQQELKVMEYWLNKRKFTAIGEIGIDLYWDKTFFEQQQDAFRTQIGWAKKYNIPYVIHSRNAFDETMAIVNEFKNEKIKAIFHCFSGNVEQAEQVISAGLPAGASLAEAGDFKLGIGGVVTFKNSGLDKVVEAIDLKHLVLETDAPYLAPVPFRGKRNDPNYLVLIARKVADIKNISIEEVAAVTTQNSIDVFGR